MISYELTHPQILSALAGSGHGSQVLISDGHFPHSTGAHPAAQRVYLNIAPGQVSATEIVRVLATAITVEAAHVMAPSGDEPEPAAFADFASLLPDVELQRLDRWAFYAACKADTVALVVASGDLRPFANILLTQGVRPFGHLGNG